MSDPITEPFRRMAMLQLIDDVRNLQADKAALIEALSHAVSITENYAGTSSYKGRMERWLDGAMTILAQVEGKG